MEDFHNLSICPKPEDKCMECNPLMDVQEVLNWSPSNCCFWKVRPLAGRTAMSCVGASQNCHQTQPRPARLLDRHTVPRTLVCHDMKGGYLDDRFVYGSEKHTEYRFFHWAAIDIFVYFSHRFVTVCPPVWVNAAHLHGVLILGTIITEWDVGKKLMEELLHGPKDVMEKFINQLVLMCEHYGMDGWLINIENKVDPDDVPKLRDFVAMLTEAMHKKIPHSQVLWYDSVISTGELKWQNELNKKNKLFFDVCDGIFLNYVWNEKNLAKSTKEAGIRALDVFVGVDIFGRNCYGGGGFNTSAAVEKVRAQDLSVALFAQGWVHECWAQENFTPLEYIFWRRLWTLLLIHGPTQLPYETSFCQGYGLKKYFLGAVEDEKPWHNLSLQMHQPCLPLCVPDGADDGVLDKKSKFCEKLTGCVQHWAKDAFIGGGCLLLQRPATIDVFGSTVYHKLLMCSFEVSPKMQLLVSCAAKIPEEVTSSLDDMALCLLCQDSDRGNHRTETISMCKRDDDFKSLEASNKFLKCFSKKDPENNWILNHFLIKPREGAYKITEVSCAMGPKSTEVLLGWVSIYPI